MNTWKKLLRWWCLLWCREDHTKAKELYEKLAKENPENP